MLSPQLFVHQPPVPPKTTDKPPPDPTLLPQICVRLPGQPIQCLRMAQADLPSFFASKGLPQDRTMVTRIAGVWTPTFRIRGGGFLNDGTNWCYQGDDKQCPSYGCPPSHNLD